MKELRKFVRHNNGNRNIYVAPNPTCQLGGVRHSAADVTHWSYFLIDMDPVCLDPAKHGKACDKCWKKADPEAALEEALLWIGEWNGRDFKRDRPIIIDSGRGRQAWIRLADVPLPDDDARGVVRRTNSYWLKRLDEHLGLIHGCKIDTSVSDLPRVMRCPGTINIKTGREARFVEAPSRVFGGFAELLSRIPENVKRVPEIVKVSEGTRWQKATFRLTKMAQDYLKFGHEEPGRHMVMWHTAKKFAEVGVTKEEARKALRWANRLKGPDMELSAEEVEHALETAYGA